MSTIPVSEVLVSPEEYIEGELHSEVRHEYYAGRIEAMAGASDAHNIITGNFFGELFAHLRGSPCRPYVNDMKVRIRVGLNDWYYYPDVMVRCGAAGQQKYFTETPAVIVEVLSEATDRKDKREKLVAYRLLPSLHTYILAEQDRREVTVHRLVNGEWTEATLRGSDTLTIPELNFSTTLDAIYAETGL